MDAIFKMVLTTSLYAGIVGIVILLIKTILKNKLNPKWHYLLWGVLILKLILPFGPESAFSLFNFVQPIAHGIDYSLGAEPARDQIPFTSEENVKSNNPTTLSSEGYLTPTQDFSDNLKDKLPTIWFSGLVLVLLWLIYANFSFARKLRANERSVPSAIRELMEKCKVLAGVSGNIDIVIQDVVQAPSLIGILKPKVLLTSDILRLSEQDISFILLHELSHFRRKDVLVNYLLLALQMIHWFNPIIWYCFLRIRQDMEVAADERVLSLLHPNEHKNYGKALLAVLENLNVKNRWAPKLVGMVDDRKNIERRIKMIKMAEFFKSHKRRVILTGILCLIILGGLLWTSALAQKTPAEIGEASQYDPELLLKYKTEYVGDNVKVINLIDSLSLPYQHTRQAVSLQTEKQPYGVTVNYTIQGDNTSAEKIVNAFRQNALLMFALINNVDVINFNWSTGGEQQKFTVTRAQLQESYTKDLRDYAKDINTLNTLINSCNLVLVVWPEKYTPAMSSTPGIKFDARFNGSADKIKYSADQGMLISWDSQSGNISEKGQTTEMSIGIPVYWSPLRVDSAILKEGFETLVKVQVLKNNQIAAEKQLKIKYDGTLYSPVLTSPDVISQSVQISAQSQNLIEEAVSKAIKEQGKSYLQGEVVTEGHQILKVEEKDNIIIAYTVASVGWFGFENGIFTGISGSGAIPTVMRFAKNASGEYSLFEYREPMDGAGYTESIKKNFPQQLWNDVLTSEKYPDLAKQKEDQAKLYLQSIGRNAQVSAQHVEKKLVQINVEASNKLFTELTKSDQELNRFPYWIGTKEYLENGQRYIYETSQSKTSDGYDMISFKKTKYDNTSGVEYQYKIVGNEPVLISLKSNPELKRE